MAEGWILAIDLGTSGPKVGLASPLGQVIDFEFEPVSLYLLPEGGAEQDPHEWWSATSKAVQRLNERNRQDWRQIKAICCTAQWSGTLAVDEKHAPIGNAIVSNDTRGGSLVRKVLGGFPSIEGYSLSTLWSFLRISGGVPGHSGKDSISHILYLKNSFPETYNRTWKFLEPKDYLNLKLCGRACSTFEAMTLHWVTDTRDPNRIFYNDRLLKKFGLPRDKLPELVSSTTPLGEVLPEVAQEWNLPQTTLVVGGTPDVQSAAIGSGGTESYDGHLYLGTSSWVSCHVAERKLDLKNHLGSIPSAIDGQYIVANEQAFAGACLKFAREQIFLGPERRPLSYAGMDELANHAPAGSRGLIFTPWLYGERTPLENQMIRSIFFNVSLSTKQEHLVRSILEGVAYNTRWMFECIEKLLGKSLNPLRLVGGGAQSDLWCQIYADVLDREIHQMKEPILANLRGAAILGAAGLKQCKIHEAARLIKMKRAYLPTSSNRVVYDLLYQSFKDLYAANKGLFARIHRHEKVFGNAGENSL